MCFCIFCRSRKEYAPMTSFALQKHNRDLSKKSAVLDDAGRDGMRARMLTVCAQTGGCICRITVCSQAVCAGRRLYMQTCGGCKQQTSSAMTCGERGGICGLMCAQMGPRCAGMRTHKFQKPEKRLAAVVLRCAGVRIHKCRPRCMTAAGGVPCGLIACEIRRYRRRH